MSKVKSSSPGQPWVAMVTSAVGSSASCHIIQAPWRQFISADEFNQMKIRRLTVFSCLLSIQVWRNKDVVWRKLASWKKWQKNGMHYPKVNGKKWNKKAETNKIAYAKDRVSKPTSQKKSFNSKRGVKKHQDWQKRKKAKRQNRPHY